MDAASQKTSLDLLIFTKLAVTAMSLLMTDKEDRSHVSASICCINTRDEVYNVIQQLTSIFRGIATTGLAL